MHRISNSKILFTFIGIFIISLVIMGVVIYEEPKTCDDPKIKTTFITTFTGDPPVVNIIPITEKICEDR